MRGWKLMLALTVIQGASLSLQQFDHCQIELRLTRMGGTSEGAFEGVWIRTTAQFRKIVPFQNRQVKSGRLGSDWDLPIQIQRVPIVDNIQLINIGFKCTHCASSGVAAPYTSRQNPTQHNRGTLVVQPFSCAALLSASSGWCPFPLISRLGCAATALALGQSLRKEEGVVLVLVPCRALPCPAPPSPVLFLIPVCTNQELAWLPQSMCD